MRATGISLRELALGYGAQPAVEHLSLDIAPGSLLAVLGPNGAGKSTLLKGLAGLLKPLRGCISGLAGQRLAYMPQQSSIDRSFPISVFDLAAMGLWHEVGALGGLRRAQRERCHAALAAVGMDGHADATLDTLSGGQFQRVLFARLMLQDAAVLLLDEPFAAVDEPTTRDLVAMLQRWHGEGRSIIAVLHDAELARQRFDQALLLGREAVAWGRATQVLAPPPLPPSVPAGAAQYAAAVAP